MCCLYQVQLVNNLRIILADRRYHPVGADDLRWVVDKNMDEGLDSDSGLSDPAEVRVMNAKLSPVK